MIKFTNTSNHGGVCLFYKTRRFYVQFRVSTSFMLVLLAVRTTTVFIPPLIYHYCLKDEKFFGHFLLSRINKLDQDFLH